MANLVTSATSAGVLGSAGQWGTWFPSGWSYSGNGSYTTLWTLTGSGSLEAVVCIKRDKWNTGQYSDIAAYAIGGQAPIVKEIDFQYDGNGDNYLIEISTINGSGATLTIQYRT